jgi:hypothetical protein
MDLPDLSTTSTIITIAGGALAILGIIFGWFGKAWRWAVDVVQRLRTPKGKLLLFYDQCELHIGQPQPAALPNSPTSSPILR